MSLRGLDGEWYEHIAPEHEQYVGDQRADEFDHDPELDWVVGTARPSRATHRPASVPGGASPAGLTVSPFRGVPDALCPQARPTR